MDKVLELIGTATLLDSLRTFEGTFESPFRSHLFFGKLTYQPLERHRVELSANIRDEYDIRSFGGNIVLVGSLTELSCLLHDLCIEHL